MTTAARFAATFERTARHFGDGAQASIRQPMTLLEPATGRLKTQLSILATVAIGGSSVDLIANAVTGTLPKGTTLTIGADATTYTTTNSVTAADDKLAGVTLTPVLVAEATANALVTITQTYGVVTAYAWRQAFLDSEIDNKAIQATDYRLIVATDQEYGPGVVVVFDGEVQSVVSVLPHSPGATQAGLRLQVRG